MGIVLIIQLIIKAVAVKINMTSAVFTLLTGDINRISLFEGVFPLTEPFTDDKIAALYQKPL